jgi:hypothetical protein
MKRTMLPVAAVLFLLLASAPANAGLVQVGATGVHRTDFLIGMYQSVAQEFTLASETDVSSIWLAIQGNPFQGADYRLSITDTLSLTGGTTYWSANSYSNLNTFSPVGLTLAAGTYYLLAQTTFSSTAGNLTVACVPTGGVTCNPPVSVVTELVGGSVGSIWLYDGSQFHSGTWQSNQYYIANFGIEGVESVPDSGFALVLLGVGLAGLGALRKRWQ